MGNVIFKLSLIFFIMNIKFPAFLGISHPILMNDNLKEILKNNCRRSTFLGNVVFFGGSVFAGAEKGRGSSKKVFKAFPSDGDFLNS